MPYLWNELNVIVEKQNKQKEKLKLWNKHIIKTKYTHNYKIINYDEKAQIISQISYVLLVKCILIYMNTPYKKKTHT